MMDATLSSYLTASTIFYMIYQNTFFLLNSYHLLKFSGNKVSDYLQGQLTANINKVTIESMQPSALCNVQGRVIALMDMVYLQDYVAVLRADLIASVMHAMKKTAQFSRVSIIPNTLSYQVVGLSIPKLSLCSFELPKTPYSLIPFEWGCIYRLSDERFIALIEQSQLSSIISQHFTNFSLKDETDWHTLGLQQGYCEITNETTGLFLPHRLNLPELGYISFDKGCYLGQEIIARMHYRSTPKHELVIGNINKPSMAPKPGQPIFTEKTRQNIGELLDISSLNSNEFCYAASLLIDRPKDEALSFS